MSKKILTNLGKIVTLESFSNVFDELKNKDSKKIKEIKSGLHKCVDEIHTELEKVNNDTAQLKYLLYKESVDVRAHSRSYLSYSEMMATREIKLWEFSFGLTEEFFDLVSDALDKYFATKLEIILKELVSNYGWSTGLKDSGKKMGVVANWTKKYAKKGFEFVGVDVLDDQDLIDTKGIVEKLLSVHLDSENVGKDIVKILAKGQDLYKTRWEEEIKIQTPKFKDLEVLSSPYSEGLIVNPEFELSMTEQTFIIGVSSAVVGSLGLAAGWHTLTYAMLNVFPPIALFAAVGTLLIAVFTKDKALETRKKQIKEALNQYHRHFLLQIEIEKLEELGDKTLREAMNEQSRETIQTTVKQWSKAISGELDVQDYRRIISAFEDHLELVEGDLKELQ